MENQPQSNRPQTNPNSNTSNDQTGQQNKSGQQDKSNEGRPQDADKGQKNETKFSPVAQKNSTGNMSGISNERNDDKEESPGPSTGSSSPKKAN